MPSHWALAKRQGNGTVTAIESSNLSCPFNKIYILRWRVYEPEQVMITTFIDEDVRVVYVDGDWYFVLDDICRAVMIKNPWDVAGALQAKWLRKVTISARHIVSGIGSTEVTSGKCPQRARKSHVYTCVNEYGVYEALSRSRKLEARQFREWTYEILSTLRKKEGIATYNLAKLTKKETQDRILDHINHAKYDGWTMYYDEATDWWFVQCMDRHGDVTFEPVDDPYGRPFKFGPDYQPKFNTNNPTIFAPCPWYDCKPVGED